MTFVSSDCGLAQFARLEQRQHVGGGERYVVGRDVLLACPGYGHGECGIVAALCRANGSGANCISIARRGYEGPYRCDPG